MCAVLRVHGLGSTIKSLIKELTESPYKETERPDEVGPSGQLWCVSHLFLYTFFILSG